MSVARPRQLPRPINQRHFCRQSLVVTLLILSFRATAMAHRADYIDETLVFQTVEEGSMEPEYWFDYGHDGESDTYFQRHNFAMEYGLTHYLMIDSRVTIDHPENRNTNFDSGRFEVRDRFGEEGDRPVDVALSGEMNMRRLEDGHYQYGIEPRLILSKDFSKDEYHTQCCRGNAGQSGYAER